MTPSELLKAEQKLFLESINQIIELHERKLSNRLQCKLGIELEADELLVEGLSKNSVYIGKGTKKFRIYDNNGTFVVSWFSGCLASYSEQEQKDYFKLLTFCVEEVLNNTVFVESLRASMNGIAKLDATYNEMSNEIDRLEAIENTTEMERFYKKLKVGMKFPHNFLKSELEIIKITDKCVTYKITWSETVWLHDRTTKIKRLSKTEFFNKDLGYDIKMNDE